MDRKAIHEFALKYYELFDNPNTKEYELDTTFGDECKAFGFEMDLGKRFAETFKESSFDDLSVFERIGNTDEDIDLLGSGIVSHWRFITHWDCSDLTNPTNREWFKAALKRLAEITEE